MRIIHLVLISLFSAAILSCKENATVSDTSFVKSVPLSSINNKNTITIAFYNVENLFDTRFDGTEYAEYNPAVSNWDDKMAYLKASNIADVITAMNPDIIGLCEVESITSLKMLKTTLKNKGVDYKYSAFGDLPIKTNTCTALLSKFPLKNTNFLEVRMDDGKISRSILEADIVAGCKEITLFVNHWPSQMHPESARIKAATVLRDRIRQIDKHREIVLIGDFNSNYDELKKNKKSHSDKTGLNHYIGTVNDSNGMTSYITEFDMIQKRSGFYDLWFDLPVSQRMSEVYKGYNQTLDHILLNNSLFDSSGISYIDNSFHTFTFNGRLIRGNTPYRWEFKKNGKVKMHTGNGYSDHLPLMASFVCKPFTDEQENYALDSTGETNSLVSENQSTYSTQVPSNWTICENSVFLTESKISETSKATHISMKSIQKNCSVARKSMYLSQSFIHLKIRGTGKISFRIRKGESDWIYFNAPDFKKPMETAKYKAINLTDWDNIELKLPSTMKNSSIEIEIRAGKESDFNFDILE